MKKLIFCLIVLVLCVSSLFAAKNVGDYTLDQVTDPDFYLFVDYMWENDFLNDYYMYGIYNNDGYWSLNLTETSDSTHDIVMEFGEYGVNLYECFDLDASYCLLGDILLAVNNRNFDNANWTTFSYSLETGCFYSSLRLTYVGLTEEMLRDELDWFRYVNKMGVESIAEELGL